jgi:translation elongation factor EF-G
MFTCLRDGHQTQTSVVEGMNFSLKRRRFTLVEENEKSRRQIISLKGKVLSTKHPKFFIVELKSNDQSVSYIETYPKEEFQLKIQDQIITIH